MRAFLTSLSLLALFAVATPAPAQEQPTPPFVQLGLHESIPWTFDPEVFIDGRRVKRRLELEVDRSAILDAAIEKAKAQDRLVLWFIPRIVEGQNHGRQMYRAPVLDLYAMQVLFNDPDVAAMVGTRFVPVRLVCDETLSARYDLRPLEFIEPAIVLLDGDGKIVHSVERLRTFDAPWLLETLHLSLARAGVHGDASTAAGPEGALAQGRYDLAEERIAALPDSGRKHYLHARLLRRLRKADEAVDALDRAAKAGGVAEADLAAERILLLSLTGQDEALAKMSPDDVSKDGLRAAEARYLLALAALRRGDEDGARDQFTAIARAWPDDPFGRRALANVTLGPDERPLGAAFSGFEHVGYLDDWAYAGLYPDTVWHGEPLPPKELAVRGVQHLLRLQRDDGGFKDSRYAYWPSPRITPNAWIAITALAATALHEYRDVDPERIPTEVIDAAVARAERYMFDPAHLNRGENEDVYADTYRLLFLSRRHGRADPAERAALVDRMNAVVQEAKERQADSGFWAHEYQNAFCTGAMLWSLRLAAGSGADVPSEMFSRGVAALVAARTDEGGFAYGGTAGRRSSSVKDSSGRMPLCEGMLLELGHSDPQRFAAAFDAFWGNMDRLERVRQNDFHSDGELAGFFFFHSLFHASEMNRLLPEDRRAAGEERFLRLLQRIPEQDGAFVDSHEIGRSYGTAMALLTLANVSGTD